jgi:hypothetical protein
VGKVGEVILDKKGWTEWGHTRKLGARKAYTEHRHFNCKEEAIGVEISRIFPEVVDSGSFDGAMFMGAIEG